MTHESQLQLALSLSHLGWRLFLFCALVLPSIKLWMWLTSDSNGGNSSGYSVKQIYQEGTEQLAGAQIQQQQALASSTQNLPPTGPSPAAVAQNHAQEVPREQPAAVDKPQAGEHPRAADGAKPPQKSPSKRPAGPARECADCESPQQLVVLQPPTPKSAQHQSPTRFEWLLEWWWTWLWVPSEFVLLWIAARCFLYDRFGQTAKNTLEHCLPKYCECGPDKLLELMREQLLPSQQQAFDEVIQLIESRPLSEQPEIIAIKGAWGAGKTILLDTITQYFDVRSRRRVLQPVSASQKSGSSSRASFQDHASPFAIRDAEGQPVKSVVVPVNVWSESTEREFHLALFERLVGHPEVPAVAVGSGWPLFLQECHRWFHYPLMLLPTYILKYCGNIFSGGKVTLPGGMSFSLNLSDMLWRWELDQTLHDLRKYNYRVIWAIDDLDRTSPDMAQAALSVIRRFLNHPGSIVLLPYVEDQLRYKVFNLLMQTRTDIEATMFAVIWNRVMTEDAAHLHGPGENALTRLLGTSFREPFPPEAEGAAGTHPDDQSSRTQRRIGGFSLAKWFPQHFGQSLTPEAVSALLTAEPDGTFSRYLKASLVDYYIHEITPGERRKLAFLFEEKYLHQMPVRIRRISAEDLQEIPFKFTDIKPWALDGLYYIGARPEEILVFDPTWRIPSSKLVPIPDTPVELDAAMPSEIPREFRRLIQKSIETLMRVFQVKHPTADPKIRHLTADLHDKLIRLDDEYTDSEDDARVVELMEAARELSINFDEELILGKTTRTRIADLLGKSADATPEDAETRLMRQRRVAKCFAFLVLVSYRQVSRYSLRDA